MQRAAGNFEVHCCERMLWSSGKFDGPRALCGNCLPKERGYESCCVCAKGKTVIAVKLRVLEKRFGEFNEASEVHLRGTMTIDRFRQLRAQCGLEPLAQTLKF